MYCDVSVTETLCDLHGGCPDLGRVWSLVRDLLLLPECASPCSWYHPVFGFLERDDWAYLQDIYGKDWGHLGMALSRARTFMMNQCPSLNPENLEECSGPVRAFCSIFGNFFRILNINSAPNDKAVLVNECLSVQYNKKTFYVILHNEFLSSLSTVNKRCYYYPVYWYSICRHLKGDKLSWPC